MRNLKTATSFLALIAALSAWPAMAQQDPADAGDDGIVADVVIVTGTKLATSVQDLTSSAEIFDAARLDREQLIDIGDIFLKTPNLNSRGGAAGSITIRGIGRGGVGNAGQGVTSNIYVDGAPLSGSALSRGPTSLWDVSQVEVLRGPQSSVQGRNALAGAVIVTTADPTYEYEGKARFTYGTFDSYQAAAALSGPIIADQLAARIAVDYQDTDGFITNVIANQSADRRESLALRGKLLFEPSALPDFSTKLTVDYSDASLGESRPIVSTNFGGGSPLLQDFDFFDYEANGRFPNNDVQSLRFVSESTYELGGAWLARAIVTHEDTEVDRLFGLREDFDAFDGTTFNQFDADIFSAELRFEFDYDNIRGLFGGYFYDEKSVTTRDIQTRLEPELITAILSQVPVQFRPIVAPTISVAPGDSVLSLQDGGTTDTENFAFFGQVEWQASPRWTINLGFRYDNEKFQQSDVFQENSIDPGACVATIPSIIAGVPPGDLSPTSLPCQTLVDAALGGGIDEPLLSDKFEAFLPRAAVTYNINDDSSVFASYQRGYRAGGSNVFLAPNPNGPGNIPQFQTYDPEFLDTFEIGSRNVFLDGTLIANVNVFYSIYSDQQLRLPGNSADTMDDRIENAGETTLYGAELLLDYSPTSELNLFASVGLLKTEFDDFPFAFLTPATPDSGDSDARFPANPDDPRFFNLAGNETPDAPNISFSVGANYEHPSGLFGSATFTYIGEHFADVDNLEEEDFRAAYIAAGLDPDFGETLTEKIDDRTDLTLRIGYEADNFTIFGFATNLLNNETLTDINYGSASQGSGQVELSPNETFATVNTPRAFGVGIDLKF